MLRSVKDASLPTGVREDSSFVVRRAAAGDREAQQQLLLENIGSIRKLVFRLVAQKADAEDLVQASCVEVLRSLSSFKGEASLRFWIDRVTTRTVYKYYRARTRWRERITLSPVPDLHGPPTHDPPPAEWRDALAHAHALVNQLKVDQRVVFLLVAVEGRSLADTAALLGLSLTATKSRFLRARRELDRSLAKSPELLDLLRGSAE